MSAQPNRPIFATSLPTHGPAIRLRTGLSDRLSQWACCITLLNPYTCFCLNTKEYLDSAYVQVMENRVEFNYPATCLCSTFDRVGTIYYDRDTAKQVEKAGCCAPACTHCTCFPTCCNLCGEAAVVYGDVNVFNGKGDCGPQTAINPWCFLCCRTRHFVFLPFLENADNVCNAINLNRLQRLGAATGAPVTAQAPAGQAPMTM